MAKLPKIYQNTIHKEINNNKKVYYGMKLEESGVVEESATTKEEIETLIDDIFSLPTYSFNIPLLIHTKNKVYDTSLIARRNNSLLTFDNDIIPLAEIIKIEKKP